MRTLLLLLLSVATPAVAQQQSTAYEALRVVGTQVNRAFVSHVISVSGVDGDPQPVTWRILVVDRAATGGVRELEVTNGRVVAQRTPGDVVGSGEASTISTARLNLDSSGAFSVASYTADKAHTNFALVSYTLRNDQRGNPVWIVSLQDEGRRPLGTIHIGANKGNVTRVEGLYRGANMAQVEQDPVNREARLERSRPDNPELAGADAEYPADADDDDGDVNPVKKRVKEMFHRSKRDAERMFGRVRRSFDSFFYRD